MDWTNYLNSIRETYAQWWTVYTITTVEGETPKEKSPSAAPLLFDFGLMVERVEEEEKEGQQKKEKQIERLGVLDGLRKYAREHVLLQGKPGSGKSTALKRLLLEEAGKGAPLKSLSERETSNTIPVLVELKLYEDSIVGLIREFLARHGASLSDADISEALENGEFLLLVDGVNELPSEAARRDLETLRSRYQKSTPMIFTTRDLGLGGNLGIGKKLEMLPLSETQMKEFICAYLPETGEIMLGKLKERLREFGQTPLLLKMLCVLYHQKKEIPENLGLIFRAFVENYEQNPKLKGKVPLGVNSKSFWGDLLQEIAFRMMQGDDDPKEIAVAIPKYEAEQVIREFFKTTNLPNSLGDARQWLEELLSYHLIELEGRDKISFRHQLLQEYYAAEKLLKLLPELNNKVLKWKYLNYLKWTNSIALLCSLVSSESHLINIIKISSKIDHLLTATLVQCVKKSMRRTAEKIVLKDKTLRRFSNHQYYREISMYLNPEKSSKKLISDLQKINDRARQIDSIKDLSKIASSSVIDYCLNSLNDEHWKMRQNAIRILSKIDASKFINLFIQSLDDPNFHVRNQAVVELGKTENSEAIKPLKRMLEDKNVGIVRSASISLSRLYQKHAFDILFNELKHEKNHRQFHALFALSRYEIDIPEECGNDKNIDILIDFLKHENPSFIKSAASVLGKLKVERSVDHLFQSLKYLRHANEKNFIFVALSEINSSKSINYLKQYRSVDSSEQTLCAIIASLGNARSIESQYWIIEKLGCQSKDVKRTAVIALGKIKSYNSFEYLVKVVNSHNDSRSTKDEYLLLKRTIEALGEIGSKPSTKFLKGLLYKVEFKDFWFDIAVSLGRNDFFNTKVKSILCRALASPETDKRRRSISTLKQLNSIAILDDIQRAMLTKCDDDLLDLLMSVQSQTGFYRNQPLIVMKQQRKTTNILIIVALPDELKFLKKCLNRDQANVIDQNGFSYQQVQMSNNLLSIARPVQMGDTHTTNLTTRLISELKPKAIFMTGICAGNKDKHVRLGDVIVAKKVFEANSGKQTPEGFFHDVTTYNLKPQWLHRLQDLTQDSSWYQEIQTPRPKTFTHQKGWFLHTLYDHEAKPDLCPSPANHPDRKIHCPDWQDTVEQLVADELITLPELRLTSKAIDLIRENRILHLDTGFPHDPAYPKVHIGAMATTSSVQEDPELFHRIKKYAGQRNILGVEMEGAALGAVGEIHDIPVLVIKAVQDYGDETKSDQFRKYAAEASARFLLKFLETLDPEDL